MKHFKENKKGKYAEEAFKRQKTIKMLRQLKEKNRDTIREMREYK